MRVLEVFGEPIASGGQESFIFNVLKHIDRTDLVMDFFTPYFCSNQDYRQLIEVCGGSLFCAGLPFLPGKNRRNIISPLRKCLKKKHYDAVHIHSGSTTVLAYAAYAAHRCGVPNIIVHSHCANSSNGLKHRLIMAYASVFFHKFPTQFCACSQVAGEDKYPLKIVEGSMMLINNGIDLKQFSFNPEIREAFRVKLKTEGNTILIGHVGRFSIQKNHLFDLQILRALQEINPDVDVKLLWIGEGELEDDLKQQVSEMGLQNSVIFMGVVSNVSDYLQAMDVFILPSLYEGLPIVGIEAQAAGLPLLVSERVSQELLLTESVHFLTIDDPAPWARQILRVCHVRSPENSEILKTKGYGIEDTAAVVRRLYFDPFQERN